MIIVGAIISIIINTVVPFNHEEHSQITDLFISIGITALIWEMNLRLDAWLDRKYSWIDNTGKRLMIQAPLSLVISTLLIIFPMFIYERWTCVLSPAEEKFLVKTCVVIGLLSSLILLSIEIGSQFFYNWKKSLVEVEKYKTESAQAQLQNLKEQVNPHFLFNNLSVLSSLVYKDQDKAVDFINQLSKVYRYLLDSRNSELIPLDEELAFINSYTYLLQIRFDKNLEFKIDIPASKLYLLLPPMALQLLIENAIKHNEISSDMPLKISIEEFEDTLEVKNNLQPRNNKEESSNTGLNNIKQRYSYYSNRQVDVIKNEKQFIVRIPLLHKV